MQQSIVDLEDRKRREEWEHTVTSSARESSSNAPCFAAYATKEAFSRARGPRASPSRVGVGVGVGGRGPASRRQLRAGR